MRRRTGAALGIGTLMLATLGVAPVGGAVEAEAPAPSSPTTSDLRFGSGAPMTGGVDVVAASSAGLAARGTTPLSGTVYDDGHTLTYTVGGDVVPGAGSAAYYDGMVRAGGTVTLVGAMSFTLGQGAATLLTQSAGLTGTRSTVGYDRQLVHGGTYTTPFSLIAKAPTQDGEGPVSYMNATISGSGCNYSGVCDGPDVRVAIAVLGTGTDMKPPVITVLAPDGPTRIGERTDVRLRVSDNKKKAKVFAAMFSDGTTVMTGSTKGFVRADGKVQTAWWRYPRGETGPFYECFWAKDKAGNFSAGKPYSSCRWLSIEVPVEKVSNGCGGSAWGDDVVKILNWIGDKRKYGGTVVNQRPACNLHDAGYSGATVKRLRSRKLVDYRTMSRQEVDERFAADLYAQCRHFLQGSKKRIRECQEEAHVYVGLVRDHGLEVYDADATSHGTQTVVPTTTLPRGGARNNK